MASIKRRGFLGLLVGLPFTGWIPIANKQKIKYNLPDHIKTVGDLAQYNTDNMNEEEKILKGYYNRKSNHTLISKLKFKGEFLEKNRQKNTRRFPRSIYRINNDYYKRVKFDPNKNYGRIEPFSLRDRPNKFGKGINESELNE